MLFEVLRDRIQGVVSAFKGFPSYRTQSNPQMKELSQSRKEVGWGGESTLEEVGKRSTVV